MVNYGFTVWGHGSVLTPKKQQYGSSWLSCFSHSLQQYTINFQRFGNRIWQNIQTEFRNLLLESKSPELHEPLWRLVGFVILLHWYECCFKASEIWVKLETCQPWWKKLKVNQGCLFSPKTITEVHREFTVHLIVHKISSNDSFS